MNYTDVELLAYLDEALPVEAASQIEHTLRASDDLRRRLAALLAARDGGAHTLGAIWRRHRLTCPERGVWGSYLMCVLDEAETEYLRFHLEEVGCRYCRANVDDLRREQAESAAKQAGEIRRKRYYQSSVGLLGAERRS